MAELAAAEAWALASKVYGLDALAIEREERCQTAESRAARATANALIVRAVSLDPDPALGLRAQSYLDAPAPAPAAHYATPMTAAELKRVYSLRAAMSRKPTKRRGTKPSSLAQRLSAACHTLKEP